MAPAPPIELDDGAVKDVAAWEAAAATVLRKMHRLADDAPDHEVWTRLATTSLDDIALTPLGTPALVADLPAPVRPGRSGSWDVRSYVVMGERSAAEVNREILAELEGGATSIWVELLLGEEPEGILDGVLLDAAPVVISAPERAWDLTDLVPADAALHPHANLGIDAGAVQPGWTDLARERGCLGYTVDASVVHQQGASDVQELAWSLFLAADYLRKSGPADLVEFRYAVSDDQLATIAKLRAARRLWARMLELSDLDDVPQRQHAVTSTMMTSRYDPHVNLLRATVAAFAAGVGGADAVTVLPFDAPRGESSVLGRRLARNISHLLIEESHLGVVADPAGGAYAVEKLTDDLAKAAWAELGRIETDGVDAFDQRVAAVAAERERQVATRAWPLTGLSEFPRGDEGPAPGAPRGYGAAFEALRDELLATPVFLATMGPLSSHSTRATWVTNLLTAGGVAVQPAGPTDAVADVVEAYDGQTVVCLAGADPTYAEWGAELVTALREAGASWVVVAGKGDELGADDAVRAGDDVLAFLGTVRGRLG